MSMGTAPCSGYVLPINEENIKTLCTDEKTLIQLCHDNGAGTENISSLEDALCFLSDEDVTVTLMAGGVNVNASVIRYNRDNGDRYDDLEDGYYFIFSEDDLYNRSLSRVGNGLKQKGVLPELKQWTNFG